MSRNVTLSRPGFDSVSLVGDIPEALNAPGVGYWLGASPELWGGPPITIDDVARIATPGSIVRAVQHKARDIVIPITVIVDRDDMLEPAIHELTRLVDPILSDKPVRVTVTRADGSQRWIDAVLIAGHGNARMLTCEARSTSLKLALRAGWPYWSDGAARVFTINDALFGTVPQVEDPTDWSDPGTDWSDPTTKWSDQTVDVGTTIDGIGWDSDFGWDAGIDWDGGNFGDNDDRAVLVTEVTGDLPAWPRWEIRGPAQQVEFRNLISGEVLTWTGTLTNKQWLLIDTAPATRTVENLLTGSPEWGGLGVTATMWPFQAGVETPWTVTVLGRTAATLVRLTWRPNWLSA